MNADRRRSRPGTFGGGRCREAGYRYTTMNHARREPTWCTFAAFCENWFGAQVTGYNQDMQDRICVHLRNLRMKPF